MYRFKAETIEEKEKLHELVATGFFYLQETYTVPTKYPKFFVYFTDKNKVQGVSEGTYRTFSDHLEITFDDFDKLIALGCPVG